MQPHDNSAYSFHHHLHNFDIDARSHINHDHALAMGYGMITRAKPKDPKYAGLGIIKLSNNSNCPARIHHVKNTGEVFLTYHQHHESRTGNLNSLALQLGLERVIKKRYPLTEDDLDLIRRCAVAHKDISDLTLETATFEYFREHFQTTWPLESKFEESFNIEMNWQNKRVVDAAIRAWRDDFPWEKYEAIFFDSLQGGFNNRDATNAAYWGGETYPTRKAGNEAYLRAVFAMARDPLVTGHSKALYLFTNIYAARRNPDVHGVFLEWWANNTLRFDHYYLEAGNRHGDFRATGIVPGTTEPAYILEDDPSVYAPASVFAVDDTYTWSRLKVRKPDFDHAAFFDQHLNAAGIALTQGSWFGWYGEDYVAQKDIEGRFIYPPALQLLRALPNYENMAGVPVPPFGEIPKGAARQWNQENRTYRSTNGGISSDCIYSRNPLNGEWYVVFLTLEGVFPVPEGTGVDSLWLCDHWFAKEKELSAGASNARGLTARPEWVGRGLRVQMNQEQP